MSRRIKIAISVGILFLALGINRYREGTQSSCDPSIAFLCERSNDAKDAGKTMIFLGLANLGLAAYWMPRDMSPTPDKLSPQDEVSRPPDKNPSV